MGEAKTITDHKAAFIRAQVRYLSTPLTPSPTWHTLTSTTGEEDEKEETPIAQKAVEEISSKVNAKIKTHNRNVFAAQTQRHVAEQIDALYWNEVSTSATIVEADATWVKRNTDLYETEAISELPERYKDLHFHPGHEAVRENIKAYEETRTKLVDLAKTRDELRRRAETYQQLRELLLPFQNATDNVQPNLVTKDGELSQELDRMKILIARVTGRLGQVPSLQQDVNIQTKPALSNEEKLARILSPS